MKYNFKEIGSRIACLRRSKAWSQERFIDELERVNMPISRNTISAVENGREDKLTLELLLACCELFSCDVGYLLGEYSDCKTCDSQHVHAVTGITGENVERLVAFNSSVHNGTIDAAGVFGVQSTAGEPINTIIGDIGLTVVNDILDAYVSERDIFCGYLEILNAHGRLESDEAEDPLVSAAKAMSTVISGYEAIPLKEYIRFEIDRVAKAIGVYLIEKYIGDSKVSDCRRDG